MLYNKRERVMHMDKKECFKRYLLFIISLFFIGLGIAMTKRAELGISPVSSVANVMSIKFQALSFGTWAMFVNFTFLLGQILVLRRRFELRQLLQIPLTFIYGYFTDFGVWLMQFIPNETYVGRLLLVVGGCVVLAFGITLGVIANIILNSPEAFIKTLADATKIEFGIMKIIFDVCWVSVSIILSLFFFGGKIVGTREGTVITAILVGLIVKSLSRLLRRPLERLLVSRPAEVK